MSCIICQEDKNKKSLLRNPCINSFEKLLERTRRRAHYNDSTVLSFVEHTKNISALQLLERKAIYHESCYSNFANTTKLQRAKKRYNDSVASGESSVIKRKPGRPSINTISDISENLTTPSKTTPYDRRRKASSC